MDTQPEISAFIDAIYEHLEKKKDENIDSKEIQKIEEDLEACRISSKNVNKNLSDNLKNDESNVIEKYVVCQDRNNNYEKNIKILEEKLKQIKLGLEQEKVKISADAEINLQREEKLWKKKIEDAKNQKQKRILEHAKRKEKLNNDLTTAQLTNDLELDETETKLRRELINLNGKIWHQKEIDADMKKQIEELKKPKATPTTNIYQDDLRLLMDDVEDFFNDNTVNTNKPPQQCSTVNALQKPNTNNYAYDKNKTRIYNSNYQPLDINKYAPKTYNNIAETIQPDNTNQFEFIHNTSYANTNNKPPKIANIVSKQQNPEINATTTDYKQRNFNSNPNMNNPVQFTIAQTNKLDENTTMQNQLPMKHSPDFYNLDKDTSPLKIVENKSVSKKSSGIGKGQKKNIGSNKGPKNDEQKKQTKKKGRPIKKVENEIDVKDTVLEPPSTVPKRRKMFDPNNYDYLNEMMANYAKDE